MSATTHVPFVLEHAQRDGVRVVRAAGRLIVGAGADHPEWPRAGTPAGAGHVALDLQRVTALDAGGVGALLRLRQAVAGRGARLTILAASPRVLRVLRLTALDAIFGLGPGDHRHSGDPWLPGQGAGPLHRCA